MNFSKLATFVLITLATGSVRAADLRVIEVKPGHSEDAYFSINLKGKVFVQLAAENGAEACAEFWWIRWPLGTVEPLGRHCNMAAFSIPSFFSLTLSSKLRVGGVSNRVKLAISARESIAYSHKFTF